MGYEQPVELQGSEEARKQAEEIIMELVAEKQSNFPGMYLSSCVQAETVY